MNIKFIYCLLIKRWTEDINLVFFRIFSHVHVDMNCTRQKIKSVCQLIRISKKISSIRNCMYIYYCENIGILFRQMYLCNLHKIVCRWIKFDVERLEIGLVRRPDLILGTKWNLSYCDLDRNEFNCTTRPESSMLSDNMHIVQRMALLTSFKTYFHSMSTSKHVLVRIYHWHANCVWHFLGASVYSRIENIRSIFDILSQICIFLA